MDESLIRNHATVGQLLQLLRMGLEPFVRGNFPDDPTDDFHIVIKKFAYQLDSFKEDLPRKVRTYSHELMDVRNEWAHQHSFSNDDTLRALDSGARMMKELGRHDIAERIAEMKERVGEPGKISPMPDTSPRPPRIFKTAPKGKREDLPVSNKLLMDLTFRLPDETQLYASFKDRLDAITHQVMGSSRVSKGRYPRRAIPLDFDWVREARIQPAVRDSEEVIQIVLHLGDTKQQAEHLFSLNPNGIDWPAGVNGFPLEYNPYLRIGDAFGSTIFWIRPTVDESRRTHNHTFFDSAAGRHHREQWNRFDTLMSGVLPDWRNKLFRSDSYEAVDWDERMTASNRSTFSLSIGMNILVSIPFSKCKTLDTDIADSGVANVIRDVLHEIKAIVERSIATRLQ